MTITLRNLPISGGKIKLLDKKCKEVWRGYLLDIPEEYKNKRIDRLQAELENYAREILVIVLDL